MVDTSPVPQTKSVVTLLTWGEACEEIIQKKKITKASWSDEESWFFLRADILHLRKPDGTTHVLMVSKADMEAKDYYVID